MASSVQLTSVRRILETPSIQNDFIWVYWENDKWKPFLNCISSAIEKAFRNGSEELLINENYRINLRCFVRESIHDRNKKYAIRRRRRRRRPRCLLKSSFINEHVDEDESRRCERFSFPLGLVSCCSASVDTNYYGSPFIEKWFLTFTNGKRKVKFDSIFPVLVKGLEDEGRTETERIVSNIVNNLNQLKDEVAGKNERIKMETLEDYCAKLYTAPYFIYRVVNIALRDNDQTKLYTLGPYCFLVFNYIGRQMDNTNSIRQRLQNAIHPVRSKHMTIYRGDYISYEMIEKYQQAIRTDKSEYFKWLPFVSTSRDRDVAEDFAQNVLYIINMQDYSVRDQFADISTISACQQEKEVLLQPGVRFQVTNLEFDEMKSLYLVYINIVPSYVSSLR